MSFLDQPVNDLSASMFGASVVDSEEIDMVAAMRRYHGISARSDVTGVPMRSPSAPKETPGPVQVDSPLGQARPGEVPALLNRIVGQMLKHHQQQSVSYIEDPVDEDATFLPSLGEIEILPSLPQGRELVGGWFDPNDVPPAVRDHL